jgi:HD-GYP domain-containing protein (c-di-GMP phosphodiesterase class II)
LSAAEIEYMARHPLIGQEILAPLPSLRPVAMIVRAHHEWMDGSGYPDGLRGEEIPLGARIVAVADAFDAIISHRVYRQGRAPSEATEELRRGAGLQFDPRVVETLDRLLADVPCIMRSFNSI